MPGIRRLFPAAAIASLVAAPASAQRVEEIPNAMSAHTAFIIVITGAFLVWAVSFSLQMMKERGGRKGRGDAERLRRTLIEERERILDRIAEIQSEREAGRLDDDRYRRRLKELRGELARVVERLGPSPPAKKKHA